MEVTALEFITRNTPVVEVCIWVYWCIYVSSSAWRPMFEGSKSVSEVYNTLKCETWWLPVLPFD